MTEVVAGHVVLTWWFAVAACLLALGVLTTVGAICKCIGVLRQCLASRMAVVRSKHNERL